MATHCLSELTWELSGWRPFCWRMGNSMETGWSMGADVGPVSARVPGSAHQALLDAGLIEDWNVGLNSRACEWTEHRHWAFAAELPAFWTEEPGAKVLMADGLDYSGWILVDGAEMGRFSGALTPQEFDLTAALTPGTPHRLLIVFDTPPEEQGQIGYTSQSRFFKPRYNYSWDWCPRIVPVGVWDRLRLCTGWAGALRVNHLRAELAQDGATGTVQVRVLAAEAVRDAGLNLSVQLLDGDRFLAGAFGEIRPGNNEIALPAVEIEPWWPNGCGDQKLYTFSLKAETAAGKVVWSCTREVGFRRIEWAPCEGAPADAEPWICVVNGKPVFLQGANWVPPRAIYHDTQDDEYRTLIDLYRNMGCTVLRVWGGGILEKEIFYRLCDEAGILVWQEFPLSSSGLENEPPDSGAVIKRLCAIASSYIERRGHHASLLLWSGGNELTVDLNGMQVPAGYNHPCIAALRGTVRAEDPGRRFIPTSASGPRFGGAPEDFGKGLHHDIHGPWGIEGFVKDMDEWRAYWAKDDALFRSEVGMPGAAALDSIERYSGGQQVMPPQGEYWRHAAAWWTQWRRLKDRLEGKTLAEYVALTQAEQAEAYAIAATACKSRFPQCGGFIIWMGHDCYPCPANNSVIDFDQNPKPAYYALKDVFDKG